MHIFSTATGAVRHGLGAVVEAGLVVAIAGVLVFGAAVVGRSDPAGAAAAYAARGGNGGGNGGGNVGSSAASSIVLNEAAIALGLGDTVTFTSVAVGLNGGEYPMVYVECRSFLDGTVLYGQLDHPDVTFVLGGGSSRWWLVGGEANCYATLFSYGGKTRGGYDEIRTLAGPVSFYAGG